MEQEFDYDKYIWKIHFRPWFIIPGEYTYKTTVDFVERLLTIRKTITNTHMVNDQIYDLDDDSFSELLSFAEISKIREFENKTEEELKKLDRGYRDGWRLQYSYFTKDIPNKTDSNSW